MANIDIKISPENLLKWSNMEDWEKLKFMTSDKNVLINIMNKKG